MRIVHATAFTLLVKTLGYHWNVTGPMFVDLHTLFNEQYDDIFDSIDDIAEQIRQLDSFAPCSMEQYLSITQIKSDQTVPDAHQMVLNLLTDNETMIDILNQAFSEAQKLNKQGLMNFLADRLEAHSKARWKLRAIVSE